MNPECCADRIVGAVAGFRRRVALDDWLSLIVLCPADALAWLREGDPLPQRHRAAAWSGWPGQYLGIVVFEESDAARSYLLDRDGVEHFF
ncbi:MAG: hypothetical protein JWQ88_3484 [Rhodoferax sp.]|nr:hypothetical protein [Rhodoferax sp.]